MIERATGKVCSQRPMVEMMGQLSGIVDDLVRRVGEGVDGQDEAVRMRKHYLQEI